MKNTDIASDAAYVASYGTYIAENVAQRLFSCSVLEAFDVYFRVGTHSQFHINDIRLAKRISLLPSTELDCVFEVMTLGATLDGSEHAVTLEFERHMKSCNQGLASPVCLGVDIDQDVKMMVVQRGTCHWCAAAKSDSTMKCSCGCAYCSKSCQKQHWAQHKRMEH